MLRDIHRAGQEPEEIIQQISETVYPMYKAFIEPDLQTAHLNIINKFNPFLGSRILHIYSRKLPNPNKSRSSVDPTRRQSCSGKLTNDTFKPRTRWHKSTSISPHSSSDTLLQYNPLQISGPNKRADLGVKFRRHSNMAKSSKIQSLYDICKKNFTPSGTPTISPQAVQRICSLLDTIGPADVGLTENNSDDDRGHGFFGFDQLDRVARWSQPITYVDIHESNSFTMCIFCFPSSAVIPLHDHPEMTVFSKVLYGSLYVKAYDWVEPSRILNEQGPVRLAKLTTDKIVTATAGTSVLYPKTGGNLHCFTAITPCAVLDILSPPYREDAGRKCSYYHDYPYFTFSNEAEMSNEQEEYAWLSEIGTPDDLYMRSGKYMGPTIQL